MDNTRPSIHRLPAQDRPRERLWASGPGALADRELVALILGSGTAGASALDVASGLLAEYRGLGELGRALPEELARRRGVGLARAAKLVAAFELARRLESANSTAEQILTAEDLARLVVPRLRGGRRERVLVIVLGGRNRLRRIVQLSSGAADRSLVPVRDVLNAVLRNDGLAFALAHNHPSGDLEPSERDERVTSEVEEAARLVGLRFVDHLIVAGAEWTSVRARRQTHSPGSRA